MAKLLTQEEFIKKSKELHVNSYSYDKTIYTNSREKVTLFCNTCNTYFEIRASNHLAQKQGCKSCKTKQFAESITKTKENFIINALNAHPNSNYCYENIDYQNCMTKITIKYNLHGEFQQTPNHHLQGHGCPKCAQEVRKNKQINKQNVWSYSGWEALGKISPNFTKFYVYIIKCWNDTEEFIKIGKTFLPITQRFTSHNMPYSWKLLQYIEDSAENISNLEYKLHYEYKAHKYIPQHKFNGSYECFTTSIQDTICHHIL